MAEHRETGARVTVAKTYEDALRTRRAAATGDEFVLVLLQHQGIFRDAFYLNHRPKNEDDKVYSDRWGLFGGKVDKDEKGEPTETQEEAAEREIAEETGLEIGQDASWLADLTGYNNAKKITTGTIFLKTLRKSPYRKIRAYLKKENPRLIEANRNPIGEVRVIHRYGGRWNFFLRWWRLTPQAAFALRDILERNPTK